MGFIDDHSVDVDELRKSSPEPLEIWIGIIGALVEGDEEALLASRDTSEIGVKVESRLPMMSLV